MLCQAIEDVQLVLRYLGLLPCVKLLGNYHLQGFALRQLIGNYNVQGLASYWVICDLQVLRCVKLL